jgi:ubiquinone/menaquinone biosynthesis C-methylase UbiE
MNYLRRLLHLILLILLLVNLVIIRGQAQQNDHNHGEAHPEISRDSLELLNKIFDEEWNTWRDSLFGVDVEEGMKIGEIGAGNGEFAVLMADKVGPSGFIYANEVDRSKVTKIRDMILSRNIENMIAIMGENDDALFPKSNLDMAIMVEVYHHIENTSIFFNNLKKYLTKNGRLVIIDPDVNQPGGTLDGCYSDPERTRSFLSELGYHNISISHKKIVDLDLYILQANIN